jgi:hypothetical protein
MDINNLPDSDVKGPDNLCYAFADRPVLTNTTLFKDKKVEKEFQETFDKFATIRKLIKLKPNNYIKSFSKIQKQIKSSDRQKHNSSNLYQPLLQLFSKRKQRQMDLLLRMKPENFMINSSLRILE